MWKRAPSSVHPVPQKIRALPAPLQDVEVEGGRIDQRSGDPAAKPALPAGDYARTTPRTTEAGPRSRSVPRRFHAKLAPVFNARVFQFFICSSFTRAAFGKTKDDTGIGWSLCLSRTFLEAVRFSPVASSNSIREFRREVDCRVELQAILYAADQPCRCSPRRAYVEHGARLRQRGGRTDGDLFISSICVFAGQEITMGLETGAALKIGTVQRRGETPAAA